MASTTFSGAVTSSNGFVATAGGITVTAGGLTVTAGDLDVTAGDVDAAAGDFNATAGSFNTVAANKGLDLQAAGLQVLAQKVSITAAEIRALAATQIDLVTAPAAGYLIFLGALLELDFGATGHDDAASDGNLVIRYTNGSGAAVGFLEADGFVDAVADDVRWVYPTDDVAGLANIPKTPVAAAALVLDNDGAEYTGTGDSPIDIVTYYLHVDSNL